MKDKYSIAEIHQDKEDRYVKKFHFGGTPFTRVVTSCVMVIVCHRKVAKRCFIESAIFNNGNGAVFLEATTDCMLPMLLAADDFEELQLDAELGFRG